MAFQLLNNNATGPAVVTAPAGTLATQENYITNYDYSIQYQPELITELYYANGKGRITSFLDTVNAGGESTFSSDELRHMEMGRLHNVAFDATVVASTITCGSAHNLRVKDVVKVSDGVIEAQGYVSAITNATVFVVQWDDATPTFAGPVDILLDFSNRFNKGEDPFATGKNWNPTPKVNYPQIIKETYEVSESNMAHKIWVQTGEGYGWYNVEIERTGTLFDNKVELTTIFGYRATDTAASTVAGVPQGMKGVVEQIEDGGNVANDYIQTIDDLYDIALRIKEQGTDITEMTMWSDHKQMQYFQEICGNVNAAFVNGANYGLFQNDKNMALKLDFSSIMVSGITFHFTPWLLMNNPTLFGAGRFMNTAPSFVGIPTGMAAVSENGNTVMRPYLSNRYRTSGAVNRRRQVKIFGINGTPQPADKMNVYMLSEPTNQLVGANAFYIGRRSANYYNF